MTDEIVHLWAVRSRKYTPGPDPEDPEYGSDDFEDVVLYEEEAPAKEAVHRMRQNPKYKYIEITELDVPADHVCWVYEEYYYDGSGEVHICSDINVSSPDEWWAVWEKHEEALAMGGRCRAIPSKLPVLW